MSGTMTTLVAGFHLYSHIPQALRFFYYVLNVFFTCFPLSGKEVRDERSVETGIGTMMHKILQNKLCSDSLTLHGKNECTN